MKRILILCFFICVNLRYPRFIKSLRRQQFLMEFLTADLADKADIRFPFFICANRRHPRFIDLLRRHQFWMEF